MDNIDLCYDLYEKNGSWRAVREALEDGVELAELGLDQEEAEGAHAFAVEKETEERAASIAIELLKAAERVLKDAEDREARAELQALIDIARRRRMLAS